MPNKLLILMIICALMASVFDIITAVLNSYPEKCTVFVQDVFNVAYLTTHNVIPYICACYIVFLCGLDKRYKNTKTLHVSLAIPVFISIGLIWTNIIHRQVYYYAADGMYTHRWAFYIVYFIAVVYLVICSALLVGFGKNLSLGRRVMFSFFLCSSLVAVVFQQFYPKMLIQLCLESLCLLGLVVVVDNLDEALDQVSLCYNRKTFIDDFNTYQKNRINVQVLLVYPERVTAFANVLGANGLSEFRANVGSFLQTLAKNADVYYLENGYFAVILSRFQNMEELVYGVRSRFEQEWVVGSSRFSVGVTTVCAKVPEDIQTVEEILAIVDSATFNLIEEVNNMSGRDFLDDCRRNMEMESIIKKALKYEEFEVYFQPCWNTKQNRITSCEALLRLRDEKYGEIDPVTIIRVAEEKGYIKELGSFVLKRICQFLKKHEDEDLGIESISMNLSVHQLLDAALVQRMNEITDAYGIPHNRIILEFKDSAFVSENPEALEHLKELKHNGYVMSLDNYGVGYCNVTNLEKMPLSYVKLDPRFVEHMLDNRKIYHILNHTISLCKYLGIQVIGVGAETTESKNVLQNLACDYIQGEYFSEALKEEEFYRYCKGFNSVGV